MSELHFNLSRLHPSDIPRQSSWLFAQERVRKEQFREPLSISTLKTDLYLIGSLLTTPERNHLLAAILFIIGDLQMIGVPLDPRHYNQWQWGYQIQRVEQDGIRNFYDFIEAANSV